MRVEDQSAALNFSEPLRFWLNAPGSSWQELPGEGLFASPILILSCIGLLQTTRQYPFVPVDDNSLMIGIGAAVTRRPLPHHRAYGSVHGGSSWLR